MNRIPMNVARLSTDQSILRMSAPKTSEVSPATRNIGQWRAASSASARPNSVRVLIGFINTVPPPRLLETTLFRSFLQEPLDFSQPLVKLLEVERGFLRLVSPANKDRGDDAGQQ